MLERLAIPVLNLPDRERRPPSWCPRPRLHFVAEMGSVDLPPLAVGMRHHPRANPDLPCLQRVALLCNSAMSLGVIATQVSWPGGSPRHPTNICPSPRGRLNSASLLLRPSRELQEVCAPTILVQTVAPSATTVTVTSAISTPTQGSSILRNPIDCRLLSGKCPHNPTSQKAAIPSPEVITLDHQPEPIPVVTLDDEDSDPNKLTIDTQWPEEKSPTVVPEKRARVGGSPAMAKGVAAAGADIGLEVIQKSQGEAAAKAFADNSPRVPVVIIRQLGHPEPSNCYRNKTSEEMEVKEEEGQRQESGSGVFLLRG